MFLGEANGNIPLGNVVAFSIRLILLIVENFQIHELFFAKLSASAIPFGRLPGLRPQGFEQRFFFGDPQ